MNKTCKFFSILVIIILATPLVIAQLISELNINKHEFAVNEKLLVVATIENSGDSSIYLESFVLNSLLNTQLNTKSIEILPQESKKIILYNFIIDDSYNEGNYSVIIKLADSSNNIIDSKNVSFSIMGSLEDLSFDVFACKDESCTEKSETFTQDDIIYLAYDSGISDPTILANLEYPDKSKEQISLPTFMSALQTGTYILQATAYKQGYKTVTKLLQISVNEKATAPPLCNNDGICNNNEIYQNCPQDCPSGSADGYCDGVFDRICDPDCSVGTDVDCTKEKPKEETPSPIIPLGIAIFILLTFILTIVISRKVQEPK